MPKTAAQRMRESRARKRNAQQAESATEAERNTPSATGCAHPPDMVCGECSAGIDSMPEVIGPLGVYSEHRWAFLQSRGHVWDAARQRSFRPAEHGSQVMGVTVPGDPAYQGVA